MLDKIQILLSQTLKKEKTSPREEDDVSHLTGVNSNDFKELNLLSNLM